MAQRAVEIVAQQQGDSVDLSLVDSAREGTNFEF